MTSAERHALAQLADVRETPFWQPAFILLKESGCTCRWRNGLTGRAFTSSSDWLIETPPPTTARRFSVFAHEVGHQVLHRGSKLPRWLEEVQAWDFALDAFKRFDLDDLAWLAAYEEAIPSLRYSFKKALRLGVAPSVIYADPEANYWAVGIDVMQLDEDIRNGCVS